MTENHYTLFGCLSDYALNHTSQGGEDGMIAEAFRRLGVVRGWFVELGGRDGVDLSNTRSLYVAGWDGVLIEGDPAFEAQLNSNSPRTWNKIGFVSRDQGCKLDDYLDKTPIPADFDLLSLDVDGLDYWIWKDLTRGPKLVVVEYNPKFTYDQSMTVAPEPFSFRGTDYYGASARALTDLAAEKDYSCIGATHGLNLFFVRNDFKHLFEVFDPAILTPIASFPLDPTKVMLSLL